MKRKGQGTFVFIEAFGKRQSLREWANDPLSGEGTTIACLRNRWTEYLKYIGSDGEHRTRWDSPEKVITMPVMRDNADNYKRASPTKPRKALSIDEITAMIAQFQQEWRAYLS